MVDTDEIVRQAMEEEKQRKEAKVKAKDNAPRKRKGKTLAEIEEEQGGPVKESMAPMAHVKRAKKRNNRIDQGDETDLPTNIEVAEETQGVAEEDGIKFTGFNLREERATGYFDEEGNYVERKGSDDEDDKDAWLDADGGAVVSEAVRKTIEQRQKEQDAQDSARPMSGRQLADLKSQIVSLMLPEETVPLLLKRLGQGRSRGPPKASKAQKAQRDAAGEGKEGAGGGGKEGAGGGGKEGAGGGGKEGAVGARQQIEMVTDAASVLMLQGETDIYDATKEELQRSIALYVPLEPSGAPTSTVPDGAGADDGDDMFASDDDEKHKAPPTNSKAAPSGPTTVATAERGHTVGDAGVVNMPPPVMPGAAAGRGVDHDGVDYAGWPVKELRRFLQERGVDTAGIVEKDDLVNKVKEAAAAGPEQDIPLGYVYDANSGYYFNTEAGLYYHAGTGTFYNGTAWYRWDGARYVPAQ